MWLRSDTPASVVRALRTAGVTIVSDTDVSTDSAALARHGAGVALRLQLFAALIVLALAIGSLLVALGAQRDDRARELWALRLQGLAPGETRRAGYGASLAMVLVAIGTGLCAAVLAQVLVIAALPVFADGWHVLPGPHGLAALPIVAAAVLAVAALVPAAIAATARMIASIDRVPRREAR